MNERPREILLYGKDEPLPERRILRAGPLTVAFEQGDLRYVRLGDRELIRRVYVAVRDRNWGTVLPLLSNLRIDEQEDSFRVSFECEHRQGEIDFFWHGTIAGDAAGTIACLMDGEARSTFLRNRIGFCVLHPIAECAGRPFVAEKDDGSVEPGTFPRYVSPHQPVKDLRAISHEVLPGVTAEVRFAGDVFEMEDQRNWTDASFKTYSTPLRLPIPVEVQRGTKITQVVTVSVSGTNLTSGRNQATVPTLTVASEPTATLPRIGLGTASHGQPLGERELARLRALNLSHLRVDLQLSQADYPARLRQAADEARALGARLEVALLVSGDADAELQALVAVLDQIKPPISRWLVFHLAEPSTSERWVSLAREHLSGYDRQAAIGSGTDRYFTELNRARPPVSVVDLVCYSLNPQVHAFDNSSLIEALQGQAETVQSARQFIGDLPVAISPVTLKPRTNPDATAPEPSVGLDELPPAVDPRQMSLFGAAWTVGSLKRVAENGVASVTYYETTGWRGVMETESGPPRPELFRSIPGSVFPLYHVLAAVGEFAGAAVVPVASSEPLWADGFALRKDGKTRLIVASLGPEEQTIRLRGLPTQVNAKILDETNAVKAMVSPEEFRAEPGATVAHPPSGEVELSLRPYAVIQIDW